VAGTLLVERGLVTSAQLAEALEFQRAHGGSLDEVVSKLFRLPLADLRAAMSSDVSQIDVGAILFATGIVDAEKLAEARERSLATGQPVGPVLVEMGAVTRLELASALADQWSDSPATILPSPNARGGDGPPSDRADVDDLKFAMRALEASVRAARVTDGSEASLEEVVRRERELASRIEALEAAMAEPVEVDSAFLAEFQATVRRTHEIEAALAGLAPAEALATFSAALDEARGLQVALGELSLRVDDAVSREALDGVMGAVAELGVRVDGLSAGEAPPSADEIAALRAAVAELVARPPGDPERADSLAQRIEELAVALPGLDVFDELHALRAQLEELARRPVSDDALHARVDELGRSVEALSMLAEASSGAEGLQEALSGLSARLDEGAAGNADLATAVAAMGERLDLTAERIDEGERGAASLAELVAETRETLDALVFRIEDAGTGRAEATAAHAELYDSLAGLRDELSEVAGRPAGDPGLAERVAALGDRVEGLSVDALGPAAAAAVADVAARLDGVTSAQAEEADLLEALRSRIEEVRGELAEGTAERLAALEAGFGDLAHADRGEGLTDLEGRLAELATAAEARVSAVLERLEALEATGTTGSLPPELDELRGEVSAVRSSVESVREALSGELERLAKTWTAEREALEDRVAALATGSSSGEAVAGGAPAPAAPELAKLAREMERLQDKVVEQERSLVEHFTRRERALSEKVSGGADIVQRLAEITRMIDEQRSRVDRISTSGGGGGASGDELSTLKDSIFLKLEKLASSIDWRFQRLEGGAGGPAASAARTDLHSRVEELTRVVEQLAGVEGIEMPELPIEAPGDIYLALVPTATGHQLVELSGDLPEPGDTVTSPLRKGELVVVAVGTSPLPGDDRACVFVEPVEASATA
jgi:hypothetical protein